MMNRFNNNHEIRILKYSEENLIVKYPSLSDCAIYKIIKLFLSPVELWIPID
jgi:hypothetical protein